MTPQAFVSTLDRVIINPLVALLFAVAVLVFAWGIVEFMAGLSSGSNQQEQGRQHMLWGIIGFVIMLGAYAIITLALNTFGVTFGSQ